MADLSSFSSPCESDIDQILEEAMDHCVLEQVAAINCSSFSNSVLPSHIENRFQKLKTFPSSSSSKPLYKPQLGHDSDIESKNSVGGHMFSPKVEDDSSDGHYKDSNFEVNSGGRVGKTGNLPSGDYKVSNFEDNSGGSEGKMGNSTHGQLKVSSFEGYSGGKKGKLGNLPQEQWKVSNFGGRSCNERGKKGNSQGGYASSPSDSSSENLNSPNLKGGKQFVKGKMGNSHHGLESFYSDSEEETARKSGGGCLCFSPKRVSRRKSGGSSGRRVGGDLGFGWGRDEELLSDLRSFSSKEQKKRMKEAIKEEEKINKEAEKIVKWAKQVSARMDFEISDDDNDVDDHSAHRFGGR